MSTKLKCPNCNHEFPLEAALNDELNDLLEATKNQYREQMVQFKKERENEFSFKEAQLRQQVELQEESFKKRLGEELAKKNKVLEENLRKSLSEDFENEIKILKESAIEDERKLKISRQKELEFLQKEKALNEREAEMELQVQRQLQMERGKLKEQLQKEEIEKNAVREDEHKMRLRELELQLEVQKKLAEEMRRKAEQGSMQLQGEAQELELENLLRESFPFDIIEEVGKGVNGADCVQIVRNRFGSEVGKIIFESKRTKAFSIEWVEKLKKDLRIVKADVAIIVTQTLPKDMERFGEKEGIYICTFSEVSSVVLLLRNGIIKLAEARKGQENKGDKMVMLYDYLTSNEFVEQWKAIREGFLSMKLSIQKERDAMERLWKQREKQLEKVLLNATHIRGSIEGIAGSDSIDMHILEDDDPLLLE